MPSVKYLQELKMAQNMFCKLETWTLMYGILTIILATLGILVGFESMVLLNFILKDGAQRVLYTFIVLGGISPGFLLIPFAVVLLCGVCMKKPCLVLIFFIFGSILSTLSMSVAILFMIIDHPYIEYIAGLFVFLIYSLPLIVVYTTYKKLQRERVHIPSVKLGASDVRYHDLAAVTSPDDGNKYRKVETWALIYGISSIVISSVGIFIGVAVVVYFCLNNLNSGFFTTFLMAAFAPAPGLLMLPFSIVLVYGVSQKKAVLVQTYFIFGMISLLVTIAACLFFIIKEMEFVANITNTCAMKREYVALHNGTMESDDTAFCTSIDTIVHPEIGATYLVMYLIYSLPLAVVFMTFRKFRSSESYNNYSNKF